MKRNNSIFLISAFLIAIFLVSLIPATIANTNSVEEEPRATNIGVGTTDGKFTRTELVKSYTLDVTPGFWNITVETFSVGLDVSVHQLIQEFSLYLDEYIGMWDYIDDDSLGYSDVYMLWGGLFPIVSDGSIMLILGFSGIETEANWTDAYHYKIYVNKVTDLATETNGNVNIYLEENSAKFYPFKVATSGWYNLTFSDNDTSAQGYWVISSENGDVYDEYGFDSYSSYFKGVYYFRNDITYYYIIFGSSTQGINANFSLTPMTVAATIAETGSTSLDFAADEDYKLVTWTGSPEGLYTVKLTLPGGVGVNDIDFTIHSYSSELPDLWVNNNVTMFIAPQIVKDWSMPLPEGDVHWSSYLAYARDNIPDGCVVLDTIPWSNEVLGIMVDKDIAGAVSDVGFTIEEHTMETLTPGGPSVSVTVNDSQSDTGFNVLNFNAKFGYEYKIMADPDSNSHEFGVEVDSFLVTPEQVEDIEGPLNFTVVHEIVGGAIGSGDDQTFYIICDVETSGLEWGTVSYNLTETAPTSIDVGDEVTEVLTMDDYLQVYQVELKKDKAYSIDFSADVDAIAEMFMAIVVGTDGKIPDIKATKSYLGFIEIGEPFVGALISPYEGFPSNQITIESLEDQTIYIVVMAPGPLVPSTVHLKVSKMEEPFGFEGILAYLVLGLIPVAFIIGLLVQQKKGILK